MPPRQLLLLQQERSGVGCLGKEDRQRLADKIDEGTPGTVSKQKPSTGTRVLIGTHFWLVGLKWVPLKNRMLYRTAQPGVAQFTDDLQPLYLGTTMRFSIPGIA